MKRVGRIYSKIRQSSLTAYRCLECLRLSQIVRRRKIRKRGPKVSIIIPVYNGSDYLSDAIRSALNQTYENTEIIVVNDGSDDGGTTEGVIDRHRESLIVIRKENGGCASALNAGIERASGEFISWLSHDDMYEATKLEEQVARVLQDEERRTIIYSDFSTINAAGVKLGIQVMPRIRSEDFRYWITEQNCLHGCTLLIPRRAFEDHGGFDVALRTTQDYAKWFELAGSYRFCHYPTICVKARLHERQGSVALSSVANGEINALLARFSRSLSSEELASGGGGSQSEGLIRLRKSFEVRGYMGAAEEIDAIMSERNLSVL